MVADLPSEAANPVWGAWNPILIVPAAAAAPARVKARAPTNNTIVPSFRIILSSLLLLVFFLMESQKGF